MILSSRVKDRQQMRVKGGFSIWEKFFFNSGVSNFSGKDLEAKMKPVPQKLGRFGQLNCGNAESDSEQYCS